MGSGIDFRLRQTFGLRQTCMGGGIGFSWTEADLYGQWYWLQLD